MDSYIAQQLGLTNSESNDDSEIWAQLSQSKNGSMIKDFCEGKYKIYTNSGKPVESEGAAGFVISRLAYVCNFDASRVSRFFKQTKLFSEVKDNLYEIMRDAIAIAKENVDALRLEFTKEPAKSGSQPQSQHTDEPIIAPKKFEFYSDAKYLEFSFEGDIKDFQRYQNRKTGFNNLDTRLTIYPAFYVMGAVSSLGKTTFNLQLADHFAQSGEHVLYFALEQTRFELVSKSLARMCQPEGALYESSLSAIEIRNGRITPELREAMQKYKTISQHKQIVECNFETTAQDIIQSVYDYIEQTGVKPIVFVDYLQLVRSDNPKLTNTKDIVDSVVRALKKFQMQNELVMFVISSLNRQNYMTVIDFESFKETGGIEYTADCVMGLQLAVMNAALFETDTKTGEKRKVVKAAKRETPRHIELCILKNRYGVSNESFYFQYYPKYDLFIPSTFELAKEAVKSLVDAVIKPKKS